MNASLTAGLLVMTIVTVGAAQPGHRWKAHDPDRPKPPVVTPGDRAGDPPDDAEILFGGADLSDWVAADGSPARWAVRDGYMETVPGAGPIRTRQALGDVQLHLEWATPGSAQGTGQDRGNSGVILMGRYEVQVLDSYQNTTYPDGQAAAVYGQHPPLVNASRPPGAWQTYDIVFRRPRFGTGGTVVTPASMTVIHNGVLVQDHVELWGGTDWLEYAAYSPHPDALPLLLQDHDHPVRYRNIWARSLPPRPVDEAGLAVTKPAFAVPDSVLRQYLGSYRTPEGTVAIRLRAGQLAIGMGSRSFQLVAIGPDRFAFRRTAGTVQFTRRNGAATAIRVTVAETDREGSRLP
jgi:hypothetical protein